MTMSLLGVGLVRAISDGALVRSRERDRGDWGWRGSGMKGYILRASMDDWFVE